MSIDENALDRLCVSNSGEALIKSLLPFKDNFLLQKQVCKHETGSAVYSLYTRFDTKCIVIHTVPLQSTTRALRALGNAFQLVSVSCKVSKHPDIDAMHHEFTEVLNRLVQCTAAGRA